MDELTWLKRRNEILIRAIAEMEAHEVAPHLDQDLNPDIPVTLNWARREHANVERLIAALTAQPRNSDAGEPGTQANEAPAKALVSKSKVALIVDDEVFARMFAAQIFIDEGFTVLEAQDAAEGLDVLSRNDDVSVLFTDISMPGEMNGIGLASRVARNRPGLALLITSGCVEPSARDIPAGGRFLRKPYTAQALTAALREVGAGSH